MQSELLIQFYPGCFEFCGGGHNGATWFRFLEVAEVAKLADAPDLGSGVERRASSSLALGTKDSDQWSVVGCQQDIPTVFPSWPVITDH